MRKIWKWEYPLDSAELQDKDQSNKTRPKKKNNTILKGKETETMARLKQKYKNCNVTYTVKKYIIENLLRIKPGNSKINNSLGKRKNSLSYKNQQ